MTKINVRVQFTYVLFLVTFLSRKFEENCMSSSQPGKLGKDLSAGRAASWFGSGLCWTRVIWWWLEYINAEESNSFPRYSFTTLMMSYSFVIKCHILQASQPWSLNDQASRYLWCFDHHGWFLILLLARWERGNKSACLSCAGGSSVSLKIEHKAWTYWSRKQDPHEIKITFFLL